MNISEHCVTVQSLVVVIMKEPLAEDELLCLEAGGYLVYPSLLETTAEEVERKMLVACRHI